MTIHFVSGSAELARVYDRVEETDRIKDFSTPINQENLYRMRSTIDQYIQDHPTAFGEISAAMAKASEILDRAFLQVSDASLKREWSNWSSILKAQYTQDSRSLEISNPEFYNQVVQYTSLGRRRKLPVRSIPKDTIPSGVDPVLDVCRKVNSVVKTKSPREQQLTQTVKTIQNYIKRHPNGFGEIGNAIMDLSQKLEDVAVQEKNSDKSGKYQKWASRLTRQRLSIAGSRTSAAGSHDWVGEYIGSETGRGNPFKPAQIREPSSESLLQPNRTGTGRLFSWSHRTVEENNNSRGVSELDEGGFIPPDEESDDFGYFSSDDRQLRNFNFENLALKDFYDSDGEKRLEDERDYRAYLDVSSDEEATFERPGCRPLKKSKDSGLENLNALKNQDYGLTSEESEVEENPSRVGQIQFVALFQNQVEVKTEPSDD